MCVCVSLLTPLVKHWSSFELRETAELCYLCTIFESQCGNEEMSQIQGNRTQYFQVRCHPVANVSIPGTADGVLLGTGRNVFQENTC
jgi:hypothetical protein